MKYILVNGGVISGVGKGIIACSAGVIVQSFGLKVTYLKMDPYLNIDAGSLTPYDHGEVFVLGDGSEVDLDLGNYERFSDVELHENNSITTGKIYREIIERQQLDYYRGQTIQVVPHVTDLILEYIEKAATKEVVSGDKVLDIPDVCIIELGGTLGDIEGLIFVEALKKLKKKVDETEFMCITVVYIPEIGNKEQKTKPVQNALNMSESQGLKSDMVVCRCEGQPSFSTIEKISEKCFLLPDQIYHVPTLDSVFRVPIVLEKQNMGEQIIKKLNIVPKREFYVYEKFGFIDLNFKESINVAIVGKYINNKDCYLSLENSIYFAGIKAELHVNIIWVDSESLESNLQSSFNILEKVNGILVPGGFGSRGIEGKIKAIEKARKEKKPFLGICLGFQLAVIEFCRNVLGIPDATSSEFDQSKGTKVIQIIDEDKHPKGTMMLGKKGIYLKDKSVVKGFYGNKDVVFERHRHRYEVNNKYIKEIEKHGMLFVGKDESTERMEIFEYNDHPFFIGAQFHPEFISKTNNPSILIYNFIVASLKNSK